MAGFPLANEDVGGFAVTYLSNIAQDVIAGRLGPAELGDELPQLMSAAKHFTNAKRNRIRFLSTNSKPRAAKRECSHLRTKPLFMLETAAAAFRKMQKRVPASTEDFDIVFAAARSLQNQPQRPHGRRTRTPNGRSIVAFHRIEDRVRFQSEASLLKARAIPHPRQFHWRGGVPGACRALLTLYGQATTEWVFIHADVARCYDWISHSWILQRIGLPVATIERLIFPRGIIMVPSIVADQGQQDRGIAQGSALSAVVAEIAMAEVLDAFTGTMPNVEFASFCDDVGALLPACMADAVEEQLRVALARSDGPFASGATWKVSRKPVTQTMRFLGYDFTLRHSRTEVYAPSEKLVEWQDNTRSEVQSAPDALRRTLFEKRASRIKGSYPLCQRLDRFVNELWCDLFSPFECDNDN